MAGRERSEATATTVNIASWLTVIMVLPVLLATVAVLAIAPCPSAPFPLFAPACAGMPVRLRFPATADGLRGVVVGAVAAFVVERADPGMCSCACIVRYHSKRLFYELSLQPAFVNIIVVGMNMNFLNAGKRWNSWNDREISVVESGCTSLAWHW